MKSKLEQLDLSGNPVMKCAGSADKAAMIRLLAAFPAIVRIGESFDETSALFSEQAQMMLDFNRLGGAELQRLALPAWSLVLDKVAGTGDDNTTESEEVQVFKRRRETCRATVIYSLLRSPAFGAFGVLTMPDESCFDDDAESRQRKRQRLS